MSSIESDLPNVNNSALTGIQSLSQLPPSNPITEPTTPAWSTVAARNNFRTTAANNQHQVGRKSNDQKQTPRQQSWRKSLNILHGTADSKNTIAADVNLVAYGVARDATADGLRSFLESKGISVVECKNLTTFEHARTHSYKVTIKASEYEKATRPEVWPYRVGVRLFKQFKKRESDEQANWDAQVKNTIQSQLQAALVHGPPLITLSSPMPADGIETSNRYDVLASGGPSQSLVQNH